MNIMKGIYLRIIVASFGTLVLLLAAVVAFFIVLTAPPVDRLIQRMELVAAEDAVTALRHQGKAGLAAYLGRLDRRCWPGLRRSSLCSQPCC